MRNYAGNRLSPWLGHLMVSRQETARPLLTPGEIMQLPPSDEIVMMSGTHPIRAKKARYFEDTRLAERVLPPPNLGAPQPATKSDDWSTLLLPPKVAINEADEETKASVEEKRPLRKEGDPANAGIRRQPELPEHEDIEPVKPAPASEFTFGEEMIHADEETARLAELRRQMGGLARQASLDPGDDLGL